MSKKTVVLVLAAVMVLIVFGVVRAQEQEQEYTLDTPALTATEVDGEIVLSWTEVEGATRYDLQVWDCVNEWRPISENDLRTTEAAHTDPADEITYLYTVQALNDRGEESDWAAISKNGNDYEFVRETVNPIPSPDFEIVPQDDHIQLQYSNVEKAVGYQARVWYPGAGDRWLWLPEADLDLDGRTFSWFDVEPGVEYFFVMRSYSENKCGFSDWSAYKVHTFAGGGTTGGPSGPGGGTTGGGTTGGGTTGGGTTGGVTGAANTATPTPTATATAMGTATPTGTPTGTPAPRLLPGRIEWEGASSTHNSITIAWHAPDPPAVDYVLKAGPFRGTYETIYIGSGTRYTWTGRDANTRYQFAIYGRNSPAFPDWGPYGYVLTKWTKVNPSQLANYLPGAPAGLTATNDLVARGIRLDWSAGSWTAPSDCACGIYEHQIMRRRSSASIWHVIATSGGRTTYTDKSARRDVQYTYQVRARNRHGLSQPATVSGAYVPVTPTPTPTPTPDPCAGNTCPADPCGGSECSALDRQCGCDCDCHCDALPALAHEFEDHPLLHELMMKRYRTQMPIWSHPYYRLTEFK